MVTAPDVHTPYDGSSKPFSIGLKPLDLADWIEIDRHFDAQLREKRRLYAERESDVLVAEPGTEAAQREVLGLLQTHLASRFPERYQQQCKGIQVTGHPAVTADEMRERPLRAASLLVQEDLILMRHGDNGWRLAAGSLCFPSSWVLTEKFGRPLQDIHTPVPGFGAGTRNAALIARMFDSLQGQGVIRWNWSLQLDDALYHPFSNAERDARAANRPSRFGDDEAVARCFIRVERQTLRKLPVSGDILFTIRIHLDPLSMLRNHPDRARIAASFAEQLDAMEPAQLDYKGLAADRNRLAARLREMAAA